ncbi:MAG: glycine/betaine transporter permease [Nocardioidaceae bacterium]|nr:glycine/betaine transporter permease [Nocardioidaceae bacterium]
MSVASETVDWLTDSANWSGDEGIPHRLLEHVYYTGLAVGIAALVAVPLGLWIGHTGRFRNVAILVTGSMRALPTLGVLSLVAIYSGIGLTAPLVALIVLAIPPLLAGAYSGIESVDPRTVDAARAMGMTEWQVLLRVEVPLALPLLVGGVRSAVLQVVATATVAAYISLGGLGRYLIDGLAIRDYPQMLGGSVLVIGLALVLDGVFASIQHLALGERSRVEAARRT